MTVLSRPLAPVGVWSMELRHAARPEVQEAAAELDALGYPVLWLPGLDGSGVLEDVGDLLTAAPRAQVALGVLNIWNYEPGELAARVAALDTHHGPRTLVGLGVGAPAGAAAHGKHYGRPTASMSTYLDALDAATSPVRPGRRLLGALGPRMVDLAVARTAGWHPFLVTPDYIVGERARAGASAFLAPHQAVVLDTNPDRARAAARAGVAMFLGFPTYRSNLARLGYGEEDLVPGGSDRLIDDLVAWGDQDAIAARVRAHLDAGADHVALHVLPSTQDGQVVNGMPRRQWRDLAALPAPAGAPAAR
jgi:probable F420-dependent oxidoreductase